MLGRGHGGLYKALTMEERRKRKVKRREGSDQVYFEDIAKKIEQLVSHFTISATIAAIFHCKIFDQMFKIAIRYFCFMHPNFH